MSTARRESAPLSPGDRWERFEVVSLLARGGRSFAYKALDTTRAELVCLQTFVPALDAKQIRRATSIGEALTQLVHPSLARTLAAGANDARLWLATELLLGPTLEAELSERGTIRRRDAISIALQLAQGLGAAHALKIVHRSLKPSNVIHLEGDQTYRVKLLDTGVAAVLCGDGGTFATPPMMSPEECAGLPADMRSDVYSLGILLFQLLTGRLPFDASTAAEMKEAHLQKPPLRLRAVKPVGELLEAIVNRALQKRPADRFQTMAEMAQALEELASAPLGPLDLDPDSPPKEDGDRKEPTFEVASPENVRTLLEAIQRAKLVRPPAPSAPQRTPPEGLQLPSPPKRFSGRRSAFAVAVLVAVAWAVVAILWWRK